MPTFQSFDLPGCTMVIVAGDLGMTGQCKCPNPECKPGPVTLRDIVGELHKQDSPFLLIHCTETDVPEKPPVGALLPPLYEDPTLDISTRLVAVAPNVSTVYKERILKVLESCDPVNGLKQMKKWREQDERAPVFMHHPDWMGMSSGLYAGSTPDAYHVVLCRCSLLANLRRPFPGNREFYSLKLEGDINGVRTGECENCSPGPVPLSDVVEVLNSQKQPVLVVVIATKKTPAIPIPAGCANISSKRVALIVSATAPFAHRIYKLLDSLPGPEALQKIKGWAGEKGAPHVMMRPSWMKKGN